jgi:hypothetical protein
MTPQLDDLMLQAEINVSGDRTKMRQAYGDTVRRARLIPSRLQLIIASSLLSIIGIAPASSEEGYSYEEQEACTGDAFRLCSEFIPDISRITACMEAKRDQLSPRCAKMFDTGRERHMNDPRQHPYHEPSEQPNMAPDQPY